MKKFALTVLAAVSTLVATVPVANAATASSGFTVGVTLTSYCTIASFSGLSFGTMTAFSAPTTPAPTTTAIVKCTRGLSVPTMAFDAAPVGGGSGSTSATSATPTGAGILPNGLYYTLGAAISAVTPGLAPSLTGLNAQDSDDRTVTVTGGMGAQAGAGTGTSAAAASSHTRTMLITF